MSARRFLISGRVQGVGYRAWAKWMAGKLGLAGWVRNLADGRVEAVLEGDAAALDQFESAAAKGPVSSRVESVFAEPVAEEGFTSLEIRPTD